MPLKDFIGLAKSLSPALFRLPLLGHAVPYDLDGKPLDAYVRPTTISAGASGPVWRRDSKGWWFGNTGKYGAAGGGAIVVANGGTAPELQATSGTVFWTARDTQADVINGQIFVAQDGGGRNFALYNGNINRVTMYDGVNAPGMNYAGLATAKTCAVRFVTGTTPELFTDGTYRINGGATVIVPTGNDADVYMANSFALNGQNYHTDYGCFILFNNAILGRAITDQEIAKLHDAWMAIVSIHRPRRTYSLPKKATDIVASTPLSHLSGGITPGNLWLDSTGNGRDGTVTGRVTQGRNPEKTFLSVYGAGDPLIQSAISFGYDANNWTLEFHFLARSTGGGGQGCLFSLSDGGVTRALLCFSAANTFSYSITHVTTTGVWTFSSGPYNVWHTLVIKHARSGLGAPVVELDGEIIAVANPTPPVGALTALAAPRVNLFNTAAVDADFDGCLEDFKFYASILADDASRALYVNKALADARRLANRTDYPVSVAAVTAAGKAGPWNWISGSLQWSTATAQRRLLAANTAQAWAVSPISQAYGAWYLYGLKGTDAGTVYLPIIMQRAAAVADALQNGYVLGITAAEAVTLYRITAGGSAVVLTNPGPLVVGTEYEFFVTHRSRDGLWTVWIRGGAYITWTSLGTGTDNTFTTGSHLVTRLDTGAYVANVMAWPEGYTLLPTEL
jgi:hypothetical protein